MSAIAITSFGYGHAPAPGAHVTFDVRDHYRDPHVSPRLRELTADDARVVGAVLDTAGVLLLISAITSVVAAYLVSPSQVSPLTVAIGCVGGRHRSAVIAAEVAAFFTQAGHQVSLTHRDIARPVLARRAQQEGWQQ